MLLQLRAEGEVWRDWGYISPTSKIDIRYRISLLAIFL